MELHLGHLGPIREERGDAHPAQPPGAAARSPMEPLILTTSERPEVKELLATLEHPASASGARTAVLAVPMRFR